jgi:hypothetical protein
MKVSNGLSDGRPHDFGRADPLRLQDESQAVVALAARCTSLGLMSTNTDKKRARLFDLNHFGLLPKIAPAEGKRRERQTTKKG